LQYDGVTGTLVGVFASGLSEPTYMLVGADGSLYVSNAGDDTVRRLDGQTGADLGPFVTSGSGGLSSPQGLVLKKTDGNLVVASRDSIELLEYDSETGAFLNLLVHASAGLITPTGLVTRPDPDTSLYVTDWASSGMFQFTALGTLLKAWAPPGQGGFPTGVVVNANGDFLVCDEFNHSVREWPGDLQFGALDLVAAGSGGLNSPQDVVIGDDGHVYVVSRGTNSVKRYDGTSGAYIDDFASTGLVDPIGLVFQPAPPPAEGDLLVVEQGMDRIRRYHPVTGNLVGDFATGLNEPTVMTIGPDFNVYVGNAGDNTVLQLNGQTGAVLGTFVSSGSGGLVNPRSLTFGNGGSLFVSSLDSIEILEYDGVSGAFVGIYVNSGSGLFSPVDIIPSPNPGFPLLVADMFPSTIYQVLIEAGPDGHGLSFFGFPGQGGLVFPTGLEVGPNANLFITDGGGHQVLEWDAGTGVHVQDFVDPNEGGLSSPQALEFGPDGHLWVVSQGTGSIKRYDGTSGAYLGDIVSGLATPTDLTFVPAIPPNLPPTADAGPDQRVFEDAHVVLDGIASSDPERQPLNFSWTQTEGPAVVLDEIVPDTPTFVAPLVGPQGTELVFELVVDDGVLASAPDDVRVKVKNYKKHAGVASIGRPTVPNAPDCSGAFVETPYGTPGILWPPTEEMVEVQIVGVVDEDLVSIEVLSVTQDEPLTGTADALIPCDGEERASGVLYLRASRDLTGTYLRGRVYHVVFRATDAGGASCDRTIEVCVPRFESDTLLPSPCLDDGPLFDSLAGLDPCSSAPPSCAGAVASVQGGDFPGTPNIWPPTGEFIEVEIQGITDDFGPGNLDIEILGVTQDESLTGKVDAIVPCEQITEQNGTVLVRAERDLTGSFLRGRVYHVSFRATDASGMSCQGSTEVCVPLSASHVLLPDPCIDDGPLFDSIGTPSSDPCAGPVTDGALADTDFCSGNGCNEHPYGFFWPPDGALHDVRIIGLVDAGGGPLTVDILDVTQDEPLTGAFDAFVPCEQVQQQDGLVQLRASRDTSSTNGRVYEVVFQATNASQQTSPGTVEVCVPRFEEHLQLAQPCVDDGQAVASLEPSAPNPCGGTPPDCSNAVASVQEGDYPGTNAIWPPTGEFVRVEIQGIVDDGGPGNLDIDILSVTQDESLLGAFDAMVPCEQVEQRNGTVLLRAERDVTGAFQRGRVYHVTVRATDVAGQMCQATVEVNVPLVETDILLPDPSLDDGPLFDALGTPPADPCAGPVTDGALADTDFCPLPTCEEHPYGFFWPPDGALHDVRIIGLVDPGGGPLTVDILDVTQDEPLTGAFDAFVPCEQAQQQSGLVQLRASRDIFSTNGRVYQVVFQATNASQQSSPGIVEVCVPRNEEDFQLAQPCVDDGQTVASLEPGAPNPCGGTPPNCSGAVADIPTLWPPDGQFVRVQIQGVVDDGGPGNLDIEILGVTQDDPLDGAVDALIPCEQIQHRNGTVLLRASRNAFFANDGRVYEITYRATDIGGQSCTDTVEVCVPILQFESCLDTGQVFNSLATQPADPCAGPITEGALVNNASNNGNHGILWPPDDQLREVQIVGLVDPAGGTPTVDILTVTQDEPLTLTFDAELDCDQVTAQAGELFLRASRDISGTYLRGRVYHITYEATDAASNTATSTIEVCVPESPGDLSLPSPCLDDGPLFDSFGRSPPDPCGG